MHSLFEPGIADEVITRLDRLEAGTQPVWGRMDAAQMMVHCQGMFQVYFSELHIRRPLIAILFGRYR